jgi:hypothetical protein
MHFFSRRPVLALAALLALSTGMLTETTPARAATLGPPKELPAPTKATPMPAYELAGYDGSKGRSTDLRDKVAVFRFWATW